MLSSINISERQFLRAPNTTVSSNPLVLGSDQVMDVHGAPSVAFGAVPLVTVHLVVAVLRHPASTAGFAAWTPAPPYLARLAAVGSDDGVMALVRFDRTDNRRPVLTHQSHQLVPETLVISIRLPHGFRSFQGRSTTALS